MAVIQGPTSLANAEVGLPSAATIGANSAAHITSKPIPYGTLGHYRVNHRCALVNTQAANSRLFEVRNTSATVFVVPTRLVLKWVQTGTHTAAIEDSLDVFKLTGFSAVDTTNTVTLTPSVKRASMTVPASSVLNIRGVTVAGNSAGMTGGTGVTKDSSSIGQLPQWLLAAVPTAGTLGVQLIDNFDDVNGTHPFVFAQNEGFEVENRVLLGAAAASSVYIDFSWAEVLAY